MLQSKIWSWISVLKWTIWGSTSWLYAGVSVRVIWGERVVAMVQVAQGKGNYPEGFLLMNWRYLQTDCYLPYLHYHTSKVRVWDWGPLPSHSTSLSPLLFSYSTVSLDLSETLSHSLIYPYILVFTSFLAWWGVFLIKSDLELPQQRSEWNGMRTESCHKFAFIAPL